MFKVLLKILLICVVFELSLTQIISASNNSLIINRNDRSESRNIMFTFNIMSETSNPVTLFHGNTFLVKFPSGTLETNLNQLNCDVTNNKVSVGTFVVKKDGDMVSCVYQNENLGIKLDKEVTITLSNINFTSNYQGWVSIGLYSSEENGVLLLKDNAFMSFGINTKYRESSNAFVSVSEVKPINTTANECSLINGVCNDLYPWSAFNLSFTIAVNTYFDEREVDLCFEIKGVPLNPNAKYSVTSQANGEGLLNSPLSSVNTDGSLGLVNFGKTLCITGINRYINPTDEGNKIFQFYNGAGNTKRTFKLLFSGFNTLNLENGDNAFTGVDTYLFWKNSNTVLSLHTLNNEIKVKNYSFTTAKDTSTAINNSVQNDEDSSNLPHSIYQHGYYHLKFSIRIPKVNSPSALTIKHLTNNYPSNAKMSINFVASTCDFSSSISQNNLIGQRYVCVPEASNSLQSASENSQISIELPASPSATRDIFLTVWVYAKTCPKNSDTNQLLQFEYFYGNWVYSKFTSQVRCFETVDHTETKFSDVVPEESRRNLAFTNSNLLYQEQYKWNPFQFSYSKQNESDQFLNNITQESLLTSKTYKNLVSTYYSENVANGLSVLAEINDNGQNLPLPYEQNTTNKLPGVFIIRPSRFHTLASANQQDCVFSWFTQGDGDEDEPQYERVHHFNQNHSDSNKSISINSLNIKSSININGEGENSSPFLDIHGANGLKMLGFASNCYALKSYSEPIKNMFTSMSINVSYEYEINSVSVEIRRIRFFKMFNGSMGFTKGADFLIGALGINVIFFDFYSVSHLSHDKSNICLLEINNLFFSLKLETETNTIMLGLLNNEILNVGNNTGDFYPISNAYSESISAYPLYSDVLPEKNDNRDNTLFSPYIVINGFTNKLVTKDSNPLFVALPCGNAISQLSVQLHKLDTEVRKEFSENSDTIWLNSPTTLITSAEEKTIKLITLSPNDNTYYIFPETLEVQSFKTLFILTDLEKSPDEEPNFFGLNLQYTLHKTIKLNEKIFTKGYFLKSPQNHVKFTERTAITYFNRFDTGKTFLLHGFGRNIETVPIVNIQYTSDYHFSANTIKLLNEPNEINRDNALEFTFNINGDAYNNDNALNITIIAEIYSENNVKGTLTIYSSAFIQNHSLCVKTEDPLNKCEISSGTVTCSNIEVKADTETKYSISCYNLRLTSDGKITFTPETNFDYKNGQVKKMDYDNAKTVITVVSPKDLSTLKPTVSKVCAYSSKLSGQVNAPGIIDLIVDLGRTYRLGQTLTITADLKSLYIEANRPPMCSFILQNNFSCGRLQLYENLDNSQFISECSIAETGSGTTISINTEHYVAKNGFEYPSQFVIRLSPVILKNLNTIPYTINTNILGNTSNIISSFNEATNFPAFIPELTKAVSPEIQSAAGLCNLKSISPRFPSNIGQLTFNFNLNNISERLAAVNEGQTIARSINEFMIYLNPEIYNFSNNLWCSLGSDNVPCEMTKENFVYIRLGRNLLDGEYEVSLSNIKIPSIETSTPNELNNQSFLCSVNFYDSENNLRESLRNGFGNALSTYNVKPTGNFLYITSHDGLLSSSIPRENTNISLRFIYDFTDGFNTIKFTAAEEKTPVLFVLFSNEFNIRSTLNGVTATLDAYVQNFTIIENVTSTSIVKSQTEYPLTVTAIFGGLRLAFSTREISFPENLEYFELKLNGVPTPESSGISSLPTLIMVNDDTNPTMMIKSHSNLRNSTGPFEGMSFNFNTLGKALIDYSFSSNTFYPGRYYNLNLNITGSRVYLSTNISIASGSVFRSPDNMSNVELNTGTGRSSSLWVGTSCSTIYGYYWLNFNSDNSNNIYRLSPLRIHISERHSSNREVITFSKSLGSTSDETTFAIPNGGWMWVFATASLPPVENITLTFSVPSGTTNNSVFMLQSDSQTISAGKKSSNFIYQLLAEVDRAQKINVNISNKCYSLGPQKADFRTLTFNPTRNLIERIENRNLGRQFEYVKPTANEPLNQIKFKYEPFENTYSVLALLCSSAFVPTFDQALNAVGNSLASYKFILHSNDDPIDIIFENLERNMPYKLFVWVSNYGIGEDRNIINFNVSTYADGPDSRRFQTTNIARSETLNFRFAQSQNELSLKRLQEFLQSRFSFTNGLSVIDNNGNTLPGFPYVPVRTCQFDSATKEFSKSIRLLQTNSTNSTTSPGNTNVGNSYYYTVSQNGVSRQFINITSSVETFLKDIDTDVKKSSLLGNLGLEGTFEVKLELDTPLNSTLFLFNNFTYDNTTGILSFVPVADRLITCDWKLHNDIANTGLVLAPEVIRQCTNPANATSLSCGKLTFNTSTSSKSTSVTLGKLETGNHYVNVVCRSPIPGSSNQIYFRNSQGILISSQGGNNSTDTNSTSENSTAIDIDDPINGNVKFISLSMILVFILSFLLVDF